MIYFDNVYRTLGLHDGATRAEARAVFHRLRIRSRISGDGETVDPLAPLVPTERDEAMARDAFNLLGNVEERLRHRLLWFSNRTSRDHYALDCMASGDYKSAMEAWGPSEDPLERANFARLSHALVIARDLYDDVPVLSSYKWRDAIRVWRETIRNETFWEEFEAIERASGFEPPALPSDIYNLRQSVWDLLVGPSMIFIAKRVEEKDYGPARDHIDDLRDVGVAPRAVTAIELEAFAPVITTVVNGTVEILEEMNGEGKEGLPPVRHAYERYRSEILPYVKDMIELAGFNFEPTRQVCENGAVLLQNIALRAALHARVFAQSVQEESNALLEGELRNPEGVAPGYVDTQPKWTRRVPWWSWSCFMLVMVASGGFLRGCARGSHSASDYVDIFRDQGWGRSPYTYTPPEPTAYDDSILRSAYDTSLLSKYDSLLSDLDTTGDITFVPAEPVISLEDIGARQAALRNDLRAMERLRDSLDTYEKRVASYDSVMSITPKTSSDSLQHIVLQRARGVWLKLYGNGWERFDERYRAYTAKVDSINRDVKTYNRGKDAYERAEQEKIPEELREVYEKHRKRSKKYKV